MSKARPLKDRKRLRAVGSRGECLSRRLACCRVSLIFRGNGLAIPLPGFPETRSRACVLRPNQLPAASRGTSGQGRGRADTLTTRRKTSFCRELPRRLAARLLERFIRLHKERPLLLIRRFEHILHTPLFRPVDRFLRSSRNSSFEGISVYSENKRFELDINPLSLDSTARVIAKVILLRGLRPAVSFLLANICSLRRFSTSLIESRTRLSIRIYIYPDLKG